MSKGNEWGGRLGIILAVTGSAVGLGNFPALPGLASKYGGGTFMIPYFTAFLLLGLPIAYIEWSIARYGGTHRLHSAPGIFSVLWPRKISPYLRVLGLIVPLGIYMYYVFIEAWCLYYAWGFLTGALNLGTDVQAYKGCFESFTGSGADGQLFPRHFTRHYFSVYLLFSELPLYLSRHRRRIERVSRWGMPVLLVDALVVLVRVMTLGTPRNPHCPSVM